MEHPTTTKDTSVSHAEGQEGEAPRPKYETKEAALAAPGDVRQHYKGGVYRALYAAVATADLVAEQYVETREPDTDVVAAAEHLVNMKGAPGPHAQVRLAAPLSADPQASTIDVAKVTDSVKAGTALMIYEHLYPHRHAHYARPLEMFEGDLPEGGPRFKRVK